MSKEAIKMALEALESLVFNKPFDHRYGDVLAALREALAEQPIQQRTEELLEIFKDVDQCGPLLGMGQPAQRKPLTDDEFTTAIEVEGVPVEDIELAYAIKDIVEAAHGIKEQQ